MRQILLCIKALQNFVEEIRNEDTNIYNRTIEESSDLETCVKELEKHIVELENA